MKAIENSLSQKQREQELLDKIDNDRTGINRMLIALENWEKEFDIKSIKSDVDEFIFALKAKKNQLDSQIRKINNQ